MSTILTIAGLVTGYLAAIVAANLSSSHFGPSASIVNAAAFIGLNLSVRDKLHDLFGKHRFRNMSLLILSGSAVSYGASVLLASDALPPDVVARISLASCAAFAVAEAADALVYQRLLDRPWFERANKSNIVGAILDSIVFVSIAFGFDWQIILAQIGAKVLGGMVWSLAIGKIRARRVLEVVEA